MATFTIEKRLLARMDTVASARGIRRSDLVRMALQECDELQPVTMGKGYLSVVLEAHETNKLDRLAHSSGLKNRSQVLGVLLEQTLDRWTEAPTGPAPGEAPKKRGRAKSTPATELSSDALYDAIATIRAVMAASSDRELLDEATILVINAMLSHDDARHGTKAPTDPAAGEAVEAPSEVPKKRRSAKKHRSAKKTRKKTATKKR